jgi:murein DD-endopeptidase MepM/ murein hydrolase activator NlpD
VDHRPSDLDPYPRIGRDLAAGELWEQSLERSRQRRRLERASRSHRQRRKGTSLAVGAAMLASPVMPAFAGSAGKGGSRSSGSGAPALDTSSLSAATGGRTELLRFGDVGPAVAAIQRQVGVDDDGIFGPITQAGVQRFQRAHGLALTGIVDARTWAALFNGRVLFYDQSGDRDAPARPAVVRLVVDDDEDGPAGSPEGTGDAPATAEEPSGDPGGGGEGSGEDAPDATPAPRPTRPAPQPAPRPEAPTTTQTQAGGCAARTSAPVQGTVTGRFGEGRGDHTHAGVDIAAPSGTPIQAIQCGTVVQSGSESGYGLMVCVRHAGGLTTCYAHMSRTQASVDQQVRAGQVIGYVGCTGSCTGPHVHVEVRRNGRAEDPAPYLAGQQTIAGTTATAASVRRTPTTSAGVSSRTVARAAVQTGAAPTPAAEPTQAAPAAPPAPAVAPAQAAPAAQPVAAPEQPAPAPAPAPEQPAPAPAPAPEQSAPAAAPAPEQPAPAPAPEQPAPEAAPAPEQAAPEPAPTPEQAAPALAPEQSAPASAPAPEQPAPAPAEEPAPTPAPAPEASAPAPENAAPADAAAPAAA